MLVVVLVVLLAAAVMVGRRRVLARTRPAIHALVPILALAALTVWFASSVSFGAGV